MISQEKACLIDMYTHYISLSILYYYFYQRTLYIMVFSTISPHSSPLLPIDNMVQYPQYIERSTIHYYPLNPTQSTPHRWQFVVIFLASNPYHTKNPINTTNRQKRIHPNIPSMNPNTESPTSIVLFCTCCLVFPCQSILYL